jgi:hypothetical protein
MESIQFLVAHDQSDNAMLWSASREGPRFACRMWALTEEDLRRLDAGIVVLSSLSDKAPLVGIFGEIADVFFFFAGESDTIRPAYAETLLRRLGVDERTIPQRPRRQASDNDPQGASRAATV